MRPRTWVIIGATSIIAEKFAHLVAAKGEAIRLVGRDKGELELRAQDLRLRYQIACEVIILNKTKPQLLVTKDTELDLFIAQSAIKDNAILTPESIKELITVNILTTALIIHEYLQIKQEKHNLIFLSSVAAGRGRAKNSLYGGSKSAIEVYLEGLQQQASKNQHLTIARLGYIDTQQTWGKPGIFYAANPADCAKACLQAVIKGKRKFYFPYFWRIIMTIFNWLPFFIFKRIRS